MHRFWGMPSSLLPVALLVGSCLPVGGCALPPALTVASLAADGVSYAATGKSVTDHGISAVMGEDCALLRELQGRPVCSRDAGHGEAAPVVAAAAAPRQPPAQAVPAVAVKDSAAAKNLYVTIGSFLSAGNATRAASHYAGLGVTVLPATVGGRAFHRVVVGPLTAEQAVALKARLAAEAAAMRVAG